MGHLLMLLLLLWSSDVSQTCCRLAPADIRTDGNTLTAVRLREGDRRCFGRLEVKHEGEWRPADVGEMTLKSTDVFCRELDCGSAVSLSWRRESSQRSVWLLDNHWVQSGSDLRKCIESRSSYSILVLNCLGALYGEVEAPMWTKGFQCGGHESALLDCRSSGLERNTCSPGKAVGLTCSEPVRLVGGASRCEGTLEVKDQGEWRPVAYEERNLKESDVLCRELDCESAVSSRPRVESSQRSGWRFTFECLHSGSSLRECVTSFYSSSILDLICSDLQLQPIISVSSSMYGVSEAQQQGAQVLRGSTFTICCSIQTKYPGGSFQLTFTSSNSAQNYTKPAVNHSAHFLFPPAEPAHQGSYSCVYHVSVYLHNFSSESRVLSVSVEDPTPLIIKAVLLPLMLLVVNVGLYFYCKTTRGRKLGRREDFELDHHHLGVPAAEEEGAQGAE